MHAENQLLPTGRFIKILLATECSEFSRNAEELAVSLASRFGGRVTAMHMVITNPEYEAIAIEQVRKQEMDALNALNKLKEWMEGQGVACDVEVRHGTYPHQEILDMANEIQADLVVMGRRGRRGLARLMVGDATARVVAQSHCKVLVVPRKSTLWNKTILTLTDGSHFSDRAAVVSTILAQKFNLPLRVISVVESKSHSTRYKNATDAVERVITHATNLGVRVTGEVVEGHPVVDTIVQDANNCGADLVVGGSHGRTGMERVFLGSVMERLIGQVSCPVLAIKGG